MGKHGSLLNKHYSKLIEIEVHSKYLEFFSMLGLHC